MHNPRRSNPITTRGSGETIAYNSSGEVSVEQFFSQAVALSEQLPDRRYVINLATDRFEFFLSFCAAIIAGQCTLMPSNRQPRTVQQLAKDFSDCYLLGESEPNSIERFDIDFDDIAASATDTTIPEISPHQLCAIVFTSGSTGVATPNRKYWETLRAGTLGNIDLLDVGSADALSLVATVPAQHMWGFETSILVPLFANVAVYHETPFFPLDIADVLRSLPEPRALVSSPIHLDTLLNANIDDLKIDRIFSATAPMSAELAQNLERCFDARVSEIFGCSEAGTLAVRETADEVLWRHSRTFRFELNDGRVLIRAAHLPETVVLHDIIEFVGDDQFRWLGRDQDMVNIAGKRGSLADLNHRLNSIPGVVDGVIFLPSENSKRLAALVVAPGLEPSDILAELRLGIEPAFLPRPLYTVSMLPRQETGKLARKILLALFEQTRKSNLHQDESSAGNTT